jgi:putative transposase
MMQAVGRSYVRYSMICTGGRALCGKGRYRSTLLQVERYLLALPWSMSISNCGLAWWLQRDHPWSFRGHHTGLRADRLITPHALFWHCEYFL